MSNNDLINLKQTGKNITAYKVIISFIFGLLGFAVNFYSLDFIFYGSYKMRFLLGLVFPMLITLAWGWRYGLLSALCGGCQTMWILGMSQMGYGSFIAVPLFTLWIVWHGWFSRTKYNIYLGELIFRILNIALLYTVFRWALTLNTPPANIFIPLEVTHSIVFMVAVNGLLIIFLAQGLLYSDSVRTFLKLPKSTADPRLYYIYTNAVILCGILIFSFVGEKYIWEIWESDFQSAARILGSVLLLMIGILCTYGVANVFAKKKSEELIKAQKELKKTVADLKRSNTELEQFAYVASHDLQEPLRMVSSYVQLLERRYKDRLDADADDFIGYAVDGANRMQNLINDLLIFSRVGTRGKPFEPNNCEDVLEQVLTNLKMSIEDSNAEVTHDALPTVMADGSQLIQLLQNLISNAIKFRSDKPPRIHISVERRENEWKFSVADNGIGIEPKFFDRVFVIFQRLHGREEYSGSGIGLAVCKKIVERHGGCIWVKSEPAKGTTFFFTIPIKRGEQL